MMPKRIILIRHGESKGNVNRRVYSTTPDHKIELTERGKKQAFERGKELKKLIGEERNYFFVSPYKRSFQTFEGIAEAFNGIENLDYKCECRIREQEWGNYQNYKEIPQIIEERRKFGSYFYRFKGGESGADVFGRCSSFLESLYRRIFKKKYDNIVLISHGFTCRCFLAKWFSWDIAILQNLWNLENTGMFIIEKQPSGKYRITEKPRINITDYDGKKVPEIPKNHYNNKGKRKIE